MMTRARLRVPPTRTCLLPRAAPGITPPATSRRHSTTCPLGRRARSEPDPAPVLLTEDELEVARERSPLAPAIEARHVVAIGDAEANLLWRSGAIPTNTPRCCVQSRAEGASTARVHHRCRCANYGCLDRRSPHLFPERLSWSTKAPQLIPLEALTRAPKAGGRVPIRSGANRLRFRLGRYGPWRSHMYAD